MKIFFLYFGVIFDTPSITINGNYIKNCQIKNYFYHSLPTVEEMEGAPITTNIDGQTYIIGAKASVYGNEMETNVGVKISSFLKLLNDWPRF